MRARRPDREGHVERDGVRLGYEVFGHGEPTVLLLPTWTIIHSRFWKMQVPYLSRRQQVITYDGPGNGRSDRITDPARFSVDSYAEDAVAVLDECGTDRAVVVGLSLGAGYAVRLASLHPHRVLGMVLVGPALPLTPPHPERVKVFERFSEPYPEEPVGWDKYNAGYWHDHYEDFVTFFFEQCFSEPHSTKQREDAIGWALETEPEVLVAEAGKTPLDPSDELTWQDLLEGIDCPALVVHGTRDRIHPHERGVEAARLTGGALLSMDGSGHIPNVRDPVRFNLALQAFLREVVA